MSNLNRSHFVFVHTQRWLIKRSTIHTGRRVGFTVWGVYRYRNTVSGRVILAFLGYFDTLPAATDSARRDCALIYDERSRP